MAQQTKFVFTPEEAASSGVNKPKDFADLCANVGRGAVVGVVGRGSSGRYFLGVNIQFYDLPVHYSITANKFLLANLALNSEERLLECVRPHTSSFENEVSGLLMKINNHLALSDPEICSDPDHCSHLKCRALAAANKSFALFSECPSGVALVDDDGRVYQGWYLEARRHNLSLGPVKMALVDFVARGEGKGFDKIVGAVLVEKKDAPLSQVDSSKLFLEKIAAPHCHFNVFHCYQEARR